MEDNPVSVDLAGLVWRFIVALKGLLHIPLSQMPLCAPHCGGCL